MKILIADSSTLKSNNDLSLEIYEQFGEVICYDNISRNELLDVVGVFDAILCNKTVIDKEVLEKASNLKYIGTFATGYNNIDTVIARQKGVTVCNAPSYSTNAVAQQVITYILMHYTKVAEYNNFVQNGGWKNSPTFSPLVFPTDEVYDKTLGIVGFGAIGQAVAKIALALGMKIKVFTRTKRDFEDVEFVTFEELLKTSDVITLHCPLTDDTADLMNEKSFALMKEGAFLVNTSRGGTVCEKALLEALKNGKLSGAAIDVLNKEPMSEDCKLFGAPNLIITPHSAWAPYTTRVRLLNLVAENLKAFINGNPKNVVN